METFSSQRYNAAQSCPPDRNALSEDRGTQAPHVRGLCTKCQNIVYKKKN